MKNEIEKIYGLNIDKIEKNEDSTDGNVYMLFTSSETYVAKIYEEEAHAKSMIALSKDLVKNGIHIPEIIANKHKEFYYTLKDHRYFVLYSFLKGKELGKTFKNLDPNISRNIAKEMKKFHKITAGENKYHLKEVPFEIKQSFERYSALHFDLTRNNIFYNEQWPEKIGFIDFDDAKYGPSIIDVAITISLLYFSKSRGIDREGLHAFLNEYYDTEELMKQELPYLKKYALLWITYLMNHNEFDSSTTESFEIRKNLIMSNIEF